MRPVSVFTPRQCLGLDSWGQRSKGLTEDRLVFISYFNPVTSKHNCITNCRTRYLDLLKPNLEQESELSFNTLKIHRVKRVHSLFLIL